MSPLLKTCEHVDLQMEVASPAVPCRYRSSAPSLPHLFQINDTGQLGQLPGVMHVDGIKQAEVLHLLATCNTAILKEWIFLSKQTDL